MVRGAGLGKSGGAKHRSVVGSCCDVGLRRACERKNFTGAFVCTHRGGEVIREHVNRSFTRLTRALLLSLTEFSGGGPLFGGPEWVAAARRCLTARLHRPW